MFLFNISLFCFLVLGLSLMKWNLLKIVIMLEFMYMFLIFFLVNFFLVSLDLLLCLMMFSTAEGVLAFCLVMVFNKYYGVKDTLVIAY
uniref:NADH dehydrogenase subunit 4L n=1 Tax=Aplidium conicum TaxID=286149 RepID=D1GKZ1_APLCO|nr:NADH dehydrogenase subunit 4L [Aplidium conicum]CAX68845.1 NADH dehydrogenase subunit 4L [Aplidium conicum]